MIEIETQNQESVSSDAGVRLQCRGDTLITNMPFDKRRGMLGMAWKSVEGDSLCNGQDRYSGATEKKATKRVRIKAQFCLAMAMLYLNPNATRAFPIDTLSKRTLQHVSSLAKSNQESRRMKRFPFTVGMTQSEDITSENPDDQEENDENEYQGGDFSIQDFEELKSDYTKRISRLEDIVSRQEVELHRLKNTCAELSEVSLAFAKLLSLLREAGLAVENYDTKEIVSEEDVGGDDSSPNREIIEKVIESYDDALIFGTAPSSVIDAADSAGAAILAAMLGGKQRMLVDVRDAELSNDPETLVQFIELAILPIAAGLEGLTSTRNRVKIVFPKVSQLLEYRRTMALAAPEVVALSTLGFDPVEKRDKLVVIVAPEPDDEEGIQAIRDLLTPTEEGVQAIQQPVVILNYHMLPFSGVDVKFETAYHLRLLAVQYMADPNTEEFVNEPSETGAELGMEPEAIDDDQAREDAMVDSSDLDSVEADDVEEPNSDDEALESAMKHAHEVSVNQGVTRAMVIRAYPRPWHIFVDLSPNTNADFEVAATFDKEPTMDELNYAIVECLEGSEREDEIVAQQMQQALEEGQLNKVSELLSGYLEDEGEELDTSLDEEDEDDDFDMFEEDSV